MDRETISRHLAQAERHIAEGEAHLARQEHLIAKLDRGGRDTTLAKDVLATMRRTQALHCEDRDRLLSELGGTRD